MDTLSSDVFQSLIEQLDRSQMSKLRVSRQMSCVLSSYWYNRLCNKINITRKYSNTNCASKSTASYMLIEKLLTEMTYVDKQLHITNIKKDNKLYSIRSLEKIAEMITALSCKMNDDIELDILREAIIFLQDHGVACNKALYKACFDNSPLTSTILVTTNPDKFDYIRWACANGSYFAVDALLKDGRTDPTVEEGNCLVWAARMGRVNVVQLLVEDRRCVSKNTYVRKAIEWCIKKKRETSLCGTIKKSEIGKSKVYDEIIELLQLFSK